MAQSSTLEHHPAEDEHGARLPKLLKFMQTHWIRILALIVWLGGAYIAVTFDIGALQLYIIATVFYIILTNLGERRIGPSAYSVFNRNCEPIMGQLTAQQFDNEVRRRAVNDDDILSNIATSTLHNLITV
ncbi:unnamed protein product [Agarophyton chilense]